MTTTITGRKGGGDDGGHQPVEAPDSIRSVATAKILLALGEESLPAGWITPGCILTARPTAMPTAPSIFPARAGSSGPAPSTRTYIQGIPNVENEITVNTELKSAAPWVRSISNTQLSAVRIRFGWPALQQQKDNGDTVGYRIQYAIDVATDGGSYQEMINAALDDKTTTLYERSHRGGPAGSQHRLANPGPAADPECEQ